MSVTRELRGSDVLRHDSEERIGSVLDLLVHPTEGHVKTPGFAIRFSKTPSTVERGAPLAGEHTRAVLREAGYDEARIEGLIAAGAVAAGPPADGGGEKP